MCLIWEVMKAQVPLLERIPTYLFYDASNEGTEELGNVVNSLIDLRKGLSNHSSTDFAEEVYTAEKNCLSSRMRL